MDFLKKKMKELLDDDDKKPTGKHAFIHAVAIQTLML